MSSKRSRYYPLDQIVQPDRAGVLRTTLAARPVPDVDGKFLHAIEANDRLDNLAYKYYRQTLHWWRVCDANPDFLSPRQLLGKVPQEDLQIGVRWSGSAPPWSELLRTLRELVGVERVLQGGFAEEARGLEPSLSVQADAILFTLPETLRAELDLGVASQQYSPTLQSALSTAGLVLAAPRRFTRLGDERWQIVAGEEYYILSYSVGTDVLTAYSTTQIHEWSLGLSYNKNTLPQADVLQAVTSLGFALAETEVLTRVGQRIVVPPRYTGA